jgi:adenosylcobinamide-GDP ribazoletransferase
MIAAHAASRASAISYLATLDYVRAAGKAKPVAQRLSGPALLCAALFGLPWLLWPNGPGVPDWRFAGSIFAVLMVLRLLMGRYFVRRIGGYTGDCLGFAQQIFELSIYLVGLAWISS